MDGSRHTDVRSRRHTLRWAGWLLSGVAVLVVCMLVRWNAPAESASAKPPAGGVKQATAIERSRAPSPGLPGGAALAPRKNPVAAVVNNETITREALADDCLLHYGAEVLESMVNRTLIEVSCQRRNIVITDEQVDAEIERMARKFQVGKDQWIALLEKERGIKYERYSRDIVWPTLALRELAKDRLKITRKELDEAFESEFGPGVKVRLIAIADAATAKNVHSQALQRPADFGALAKKYSQDANSASAYGLIQPIRRHMGDPNLEAAAFALKPGEISDIVQVGDLHVFVKCEEQLPAMNGIDRKKVEPHLYDALVERKLRTAANEVFQQLQSEAKVENVYNDPVKSQQMPGVAAVINGHQITIRELAEESLERYGQDVLEGSINHLIVDQALRKRELAVADADIEAEIVRAALAMGKVNDAGEADVAGWLEHVTETEGISRAVYVRDEVWPSVALKKLVGSKVRVTEEDLTRGYEANYGPKIRCRAIVLNNQRRAQEVWDMAREALVHGREEAVKKFGDLAAEYSIEAGSRSLRGEVPPIQKYGGQPYLEKEAFTLSSENPLSGIVQVGGTYVILLYEGRTKPIGADFAEVRKFLYADILEKKMRVAMGQAFDNLKDNSHVDNFLTGEIKTSKKEIPAAPQTTPQLSVPMPRVRR